MGIIRLIPTENYNKETTFVFNTSLFTSEDKLYLAPMQNLTSLFFRQAYERFFPQTIDYAVSPFISVCSNGVDAKSIKFDDVRPQANLGAMPVIPQILGNNPEQIVETCKIIEQMGYREVNLNMGCPKKDIVSRKRGSGLLREKELVEKIIDSILNQTHLLLSLKVRLGVKEDKDLEALLPVINAYPIKNVTIHPRRAIDFYEGKANEDLFEYYAKQIKHTIIYNGDIFTVEDFTRLKTRFPYITNWMIGRGVVRNPFLAGEIRGIFFDKQILKPYVMELKQNFISSLYRENETLVLNKMKEFSKYICQGMNIDATPFLHSTSLQEITTLFETCL